MGILEEEIVTWEEGSSLSYDLIKGLPMPMKSLNNTWAVSAEGDGSLVTLTMNFEMKFGPLGALMAALAVRRAMLKEMGINLAGLKQYVETGEVVATVSEVSEGSLAAVT